MRSHIVYTFAFCVSIFIFGCKIFGTSDGVRSECIYFNAESMTIKSACGKSYKNEMVRFVYVSTIDKSSGAYKKHLYEYSFDNPKTEFSLVIDSLDKKILASEYIKIGLKTTHNHIDYELVMAPEDWKKKKNVFFTKFTEKY